MHRPLQDRNGALVDGQDNTTLEPETTGLATIAGGWVIHPFLFAIYPILALAAQNAGEVRSRELVEMITWAFIAVLVCWLFFRLFSGNKRNAGLVASVAVAMFATYNIIQEYSNRLATFIAYYWVRGEHIVHPIVIIAIEILLLFALSRLLALKIKAARGATAFLNIFASFLIIYPVSILLFVKAPTIARPPREPVAYDVPRPSERHRLPDIYYIILDGYARSEIMRDFFHFDNEPFLEHLERKGFYVARRSTSNYCQTPLSLSSSLNGVYLDELVKGLGVDQTELTDLIGKNNVVATLRPLGYKFVTFATGFDPTEHPEADVYYSPRPSFTGFQRMLVDSTPLRQLWPGAGDVQSSTLSRERILYLLEHLPDVVRNPSPTFTFAHLLSPHPPFVFGEQGQTVGVRYCQFEIANRDKIGGRFRDPDRFIEGYRDQSIFMTRRIEETIDRILAASPEPPIIILQSDHGSELKLDPEDVANTDLKERMSILNAYYFPGRRYEGLYDSISPVNSFRVVFNSFYSAELKLLPDRSYFSKWSEPYQFIDVTDAVRPSDPRAN